MDGASEVLRGAFPCAVLEPNDVRAHRRAPGKRPGDAPPDRLRRRDRQRRRPGRAGRGRLRRRDSVPRVFRPPGVFLFGGFFGGGPFFFAIRTGATVGGVSTTHRFFAAPQFISVLDDAPSSPDGIQDLWILPGFGDPGIFGPLFGACSLALVDTTADALPGGFFVPHDLEAFDQPTFTCAGFDVGDDGAFVSVVALSGRITTWVVTPEPGSALLVTLALAWLGIRAWAVRRR